MYRLFCENKLLYYAGSSSMNMSCVSIKHCLIIFSGYLHKVLADFDRFFVAIINDIFKVHLLV